MARIKRPVCSPYVGLVTLATMLAYDAGEEEATDPITGEPVKTGGPIFVENVAADSFDVVVEDAAEILGVQIGNLAPAPLVYALDGVTTEGRKKRVTIAVGGLSQKLTDEVQELALTDADGGTFTLTFGSDETDPIPYDATAEDVQAALEALESIGVGNVECTGGPLPASPITITFVGDLGEQNIAALVPDDTLLTAPVPAVQIAEATKGGSGVNEVQSIAIVNAIGGTFTLTFDGKTTSGIAYNANAAAIETALEGLDSIGAGNVGVTVGDDGEFLVEFKGALEETDVALVTANAGSLTGATADASISTITAGGDDTGEVESTPNEGDFKCSVIVITKSSGVRP